MDKGKDGAYISVLLWREGNDPPVIPGHSRMRTEGLTVKVLSKLIYLHREAEAEHNYLLERQMFGAEVGDYSHGNWKRIDELAEKMHKLGGAVAALRWVIGNSEAIGLDMRDQYLLINKERLREREEE